VEEEGLKVGLNAPWFHSFTKQHAPGLRLSAADTVYALDALLERSETKVNSSSP
jgi:predicted Kef-type K+ transport protein